MQSKFKIISIISLTLAIIITCMLAFKLINTKNNIETIKVDVSTLTYNDGTSIKTYGIEEFNTFLNDYNNNKLPLIYITKFLFDGVSMYKPYDLDDFIESGNELEVSPLEVTTLNINSIGDINLTGELTGGMIAINTNNIVGNINLLLNNVKIDTDSKKVPAIYVYNKDITYTKATVTISALNDTKNYLAGGKLKKVSLIPRDNLSDYTSKYTGNNLSNYNTYTNYYGIYTNSEIDHILFATVTADNEDLADGDPNYFYKASGAISSDIDIYFTGDGYLEITSKNKEGIETKGNLSFTGGSGDYVINAYDDCLNTTTAKSENNNARNTLTIDVNSLYAIVSNESDEGDAIDSNGELIINGGMILAIAKPGADAGIDSAGGTYINGGTIYATGDMYDEISSDSKQTFMVLSFQDKPIAADLITLLDSSDNIMFSYQTDRTFQNLIYSSSALKDGSYFLYKNGQVTGDVSYGLYNGITSYAKGTQLGYAQTGNISGITPNNMNDNNKPDDIMTPPNRNESSGERPNNGNPPDKPNDNMFQNNKEFTSKATNKDFTISGTANLFSGIAEYSE